jgi:hypothetical protein
MMTTKKDDKGCDQREESSFYWSQCFLSLGNILVVFK